MSQKTEAYDAAKESITKFAEAQIVRLENALETALNFVEGNCRTKPLEGVATSSAIYPLAVFLSQSLKVNRSREEESVIVDVPPAARAMIFAAYDAGMFGKRLELRVGAVTCKITAVPDFDPARVVTVDVPGVSMVRSRWLALVQYRRRQTCTNL